jgi:hypothetical protein
MINRTNQLIVNGFLAGLLVVMAACSGGDAERIADLERENAALRVELEAANAPTTLAPTTSTTGPPATTEAVAATSTSSATTTTLGSSGEALGPLASPYVGGTEVPNIPEGSPGTIEVVVSGTYDGNVIPVLVRNRTDGPVIRIEVSATARDSEGNIIATGSDQGFSPNLVQPGGIAFGYLYFDGADLPSEVNIDVLPVAEDAEGDFADFENIRDLTLDSVALAGDRLVGEAINEHSETVTGPISAEAVCFDEAGKLIDHSKDFTDQEIVEPGGVLPFAIEIDEPCSHHLVALSGFAE